MNDKLKSVLIKIDFKDRFDALFEAHSHRNLFKKAEQTEIRKIVEKQGYQCTYHKVEKFFTLGDSAENIYLNLSTELGLVEFILNFSIEGQGDGGPFGYLRTLLEFEDRVKKPRFANYIEFEEILKVGLGIYEDIKSGLERL